MIVDHVYGGEWGWGVESRKQPLRIMKSLNLRSLYNSMIAHWPSIFLPSRAPSTQYLELGQSPVDGLVKHEQ